MRRFFIIAFSLQLSVMSLWALTIPQGTVYFDNSRTKYSAVRFVYGSDQRKETYALAMTQDGNKWRVDIPQTVTDMYRFTFVGGAITEGLYQQDFNTFKDSISHQANLNRTATSDAQMKAGDIFVPQSGDNWAQGYWQNIDDWTAEQSSQSGTASVSGTLPVVYINTTNNAAIDSKEIYVTGSMYIDPLSTGYPAFGSSAAPISAQFKGRGNYTWRDFDKKPYKIKLDAKAKILGMPNNKHWCLLAHADDNLGFLRNKMGFMLSEQLGMRWTPRMAPVELILNGSYYGLYFLTEHVRIAGNRINITEQEDNATDSVSGGWLVEIDNYDEEGNIKFQEGNGQNVMVTIKEPEVLSTQQREYIESRIFALNNALYGHSAPYLWSMLDLEEAARYYLVQEIMEDCESYHGSCYLYKDRDRNGQTAKWFFGPVWDFGNAYNRYQEKWIYTDPIFAQYWIGQLASWPDFQQAVKEQWYIFYHDKRETVRTQITEFATLISQAAANDAARWSGTRNYQENSNMTARRNEFLKRFDWRIQWLYSQWGEGVKPATWNSETLVPESGLTVQKILRNGQLLIQVNDQLFDITGKRIE